MGWIVNNWYLLLQLGSAPCLWTMYNLLVLFKSFLLYYQLIRLSKANKKYLSLKNS